MTDLRPLLQGTPSEAERLLLSSARRDTPPVNGRARALAALGLAAGAGTAAVSGSATASTMSAAVLAKWLTAGALSGLVAAASVATVVHYVEAPHRAATTAPALVSVEQVSTRAAVVSQAAAEPPVAPPVVAPPVVDARRVLRHAAPPEAVATRAPEPAPIHGLSAEIAALDGARRALSTGSASQALTLLDAYDTGFPAGTFAQEVSVLRVQALHAAGRDRDAALLAERLLASNPSSAHAQRLRSLLASMSGGH
jgi:hypothetical protein